jgi:hypothetical protein
LENKIKWGLLYPVLTHKHWFLFQAKITLKMLLSLVQSLLPLGIANEETTFEG